MYNRTYWVLPSTMLYVWNMFTSCPSSVYNGSAVRPPPRSPTLLLTTITWTTIKWTFIRTTVTSAVLEATVLMQLKIGKSEYYRRSSRVWRGCYWVRISSTFYVLRLAYFDLCTSTFCQIWIFYWSRSRDRSRVLVEVKRSK